jgi:thymidylate synthase ThyX
MEVKLVGFNTPLKTLYNLKRIEEKIMHYDTFNGDKKKYTKEILNDITKLEKWFTPEVITAAFARASRSKKNMKELVEEGLDDTEKARRSVYNILRMSHFSIADHAMFNFIIIGASRLMVEEIEDRRIGSGYTEKSQRYVTFDGDYIKPDYSAQDLKEFEKVVNIQNEFYFKCFPLLFEHLKKKHAKEIKELGEEEERKKFIKKLEGLAKEDARYSLCLATQTQLGCSYLGETLELAIRKNKYGPLSEQPEFAKKMYDEVVKVAPSLIQLSDPELFELFNPGKKLDDNNFKYTKQNLEKIVELTIKEIKEYSTDPEIISRGDVKLVKGYNMQDYDTKIIAALIHANSLVSVEKAYRIAKTLNQNYYPGKEFIKKTLENIGVHDKVPREFEIGNLIFEMIVSASCYAQLKRHRIMTLLRQNYNPELGYTIPPNIKEIGLDNKLLSIYDISSKSYDKFKSKYGIIAQYILTNGHRRRVLVGLNIREGYHISRLREDLHAQGDIRDKANKMHEILQIVAPITTPLLGGKHEFNKTKEDVYRK